MSTPAAPDPANNPASTGTETLHEPVASSGNLPLAIAAGSVAALIGAVLWAVITVATGYQIGFMAVGVGFLVGFAVGKFGHGSTLPFQISGAVLALLGCVLGNFFTVIGFASSQSDMGVFQILGQVDPSAVLGVMSEAAQPMDLLFYGIAIYEGFKFSTKH